MAKKTETRLDAMRHSTAHLMAAAVQTLWPDVKFGIGPAIEDGFYYDFDLNHHLKPEDLKNIEKKMRELQKLDSPYAYSEKPILEARKFFEKKGQLYKVELINDLEKEGEKKVSFYQTGDFTDLCEGPHIEKTSEIGPFKLMSFSSAYWKADQQNKQLQRIYGTAWETKDDLNNYLQRLEEAKRRDHRKLGVELDLFHFEEYSPGMPYWHPKGMVIYRELDKFARELEGDNYTEIKTPELVTPDLYKKSGHYEHYLADMFKVLDGDKEYFLKPMNCPEALLVFKSRKRSYRDLPMRLTNFDVLHRTEATKVFHGLTRVREFSQDDAHILCTHEQAADEFASLLETVKTAFQTFKLKPQIKLSTRPKEKVGNETEWNQAEEALKAALEKAQIGYVVDPGEGSFYGPKIDVAAFDAIDRKWQLSTLQYDMQQPKGLGAKYTDADGTEKTPIMIHQAILGSLERFIGILVEHYSGALPTWLSPVQAFVLPITDTQNSYAKEILAKLKETGIRVEANLNSEKIGAKIRDAQITKVPYMLIVGPKEVEENSVSVRLRSGADLHSMPLPDIISRIKQEIQSRS
jgi:threonyl-tRNA synthetase